MRATDALPSNPNESLQAINSSLKTMFEPKQAVGVIKIFMRIGEHPTPKQTDLIPIKPGISSSAKVILEFT